ncbi:uncharacterized protein [Physcomitrium patens]|uniref:Uncharacterized protein n=1 Tax=Physcomitrium patens TaxID=3218 RepID=A0A2K1IK06_PHYPA|nr:uncharacterized protein LOC112275630 [Physcomitrium patens]PNR29609.1 hypothetical protein PHYPA_028303 [Physcomitrium patens]|eukprot:XP_024361936.1 uncharacterized protein LOC112275630 [Physcomitrella patens]
MAGASRHMARSFASVARAGLRFNGSKTVRSGCEMGAAAREGLGVGVGAPRPAASRSFSSSGSSFMQSRTPTSFFGRLPREMACVLSLLPLHNATASSQIVSQLRSSPGALLRGLWIIDDV